jgi:hypothetical protein
MPRSARSGKSSRYSRRSRSSRRKASRPGSTFPRGKTRGAYSYTNPGPWGRAGRKAGAALATAFLGPEAASIGAHVGGLAHYIGKIFGSGDYKIGAAPVVNSLFKGSRPKGATDVSFGGDGSIRIRKKEYVQDIISGPLAGKWNNDTWDINPGNRKLFPYLCRIAANFQCYKMHGCCFEFKSLSANALNSTNTALGTVVGCIDYNAASGPFTGKQDMLNSLGSVDVKPSDSFLMGLECDPKRLPLNELYVAVNSYRPGEDRKTYDMGVLNIATVGLQAANVSLGELYVIYDVELMLPVLLGNGEMVQTTVLNWVYSTPPTLTVGTILPEYSASAPAGINTETSGFDSLGLEIGYRASGSLQMLSFPPTCAGGIYHVTIQWTGNSNALCAAPTVQMNKGASLLSTIASTSGGASINRLMVTYCVQVPEATDSSSGKPWTWGTFSTANHQGVDWPSLGLVTGSGPGVYPGSLTGISVVVRQMNPRLDGGTAGLPVMQANNW